MKNNNEKLVKVHNEFNEVMKKETRFFDLDNNEIFNYTICMYYTPLSDSKLFCVINCDESKEKQLSASQKEIVQQYIQEQKKLEKIKIKDNEIFRVLDILLQSNLMPKIDIKNYYMLYDESESINSFKEEKLNIQNRWYKIDCDKLAYDFFDLPSSKTLDIDNANILYAKKQSELLKSKINFLDTIKLEKRDKETLLLLKGINKKKIDMRIYLNSIEKSNVKVERIGRINVASFTGTVQANKLGYIKGYYITFKEENNGKDVLVIIDSKKYSKKYIIEKLNLKYFGFLKGAMVGITDYETIFTS